MYLFWRWLDKSRIDKTGFAKGFPLITVSTWLRPLWKDSLSTAWSLNQTFKQEEGRARTDFGYVRSGPLYYKIKLCLHTLEMREPGPYFGPCYNSEDNQSSYPIIYLFLDVKTDVVLTERCASGQSDLCQITLDTPWAWRCLGSWRRCSRGGLFGFWNQPKRL